MLKGTFMSYTCKIVLVYIHFFSFVHRSSKAIAFEIHTQLHICYSYIIYSIEWAATDNRTKKCITKSFFLHGVIHKNIFLHTCIWMIHEKKRHLHKKRTSLYLRFLSYILNNYMEHQATGSNHFYRFTI